MRIEGTAALVAGGASGLGEATARALDAAGATVSIADLNAEKGEALAGELGRAARFVAGGRDRAEPVAAAVEQAAGGRRRAADLGLLRRHRLGRAACPQGRPARPRDASRR